MYNNLPIKSKKDLALNFNEIKSLLKISDPKLIVELINEMIIKVLNNEINNNKDSLVQYIVNRLGSE